MNQKSHPIFIGETLQQQSGQYVKGEFVNMLGDKFYMIQNYDQLAPFFMSIVSSSNHWLFISSTGGLSAGRMSAEQSLFPYYTDDKITENNENTGSKSILLVTRGERTSLWEPFSERYKGSYHIERNLYKKDSKHPACEYHLVDAKHIQPSFGCLQTQRSGPCNGSRDLCLELNSD